jgi:hypothetical protein
MTPLQSKCLRLTGTFETDSEDGFGVVAGNFDGQGISFGILQWNLGQGTLQPLLKSLIITNRADMLNIFRGKVVDLDVMLSQPIQKQISWGDSISAMNRCGSKNQVIEPWKSMFKQLGALPACQEAQMKMCKKYFDWADPRMNTYQLNSERGYALLFDIVVQNGGISDSTYYKILDKYSQPSESDDLETEKMKIIAEQVAQASRIDQTHKQDPYWIQKDVRSRKMCIATGQGIVHGVTVNLSDFDLELTPIAA